MSKIKQIIDKFETDEQSKKRLIEHINELQQSFQVKKQIKIGDKVLLEKDSITKIKTYIFLGEHNNDK